MLGRLRAKAIVRQVVKARFQLEILMRNDQMLKTGLAANRTIAIEYFNMRRYLDRKAHSTAMATARDCQALCHIYSTVTDFARLRG